MPQFEPSAAKVKLPHATRPHIVKEDGVWKVYWTHYCEFAYPRLIRDAAIWAVNRNVRNMPNRQCMAGVT